MVPNTYIRIYRRNEKSAFFLCYPYRVMRDRLRVDFKILHGCMGGHATLA